MNLSQRVHSGQRAGSGAAARGRSGALAPAPLRPLRPSVRAAAEGEQQGSGGGAALSEDVIARLRAAEEEAARLKRQLADLQQAQPASPAASSQQQQQASSATAAAPQRIDGTDRRETIFGGGKRNSWLSEGARVSCVSLCLPPLLGSFSVRVSTHQRGASFSLVLVLCTSKTHAATTINTNTTTKHQHFKQTEDVDFLTGGGPSEAASSSGPTPEQQDAIRRRVLLGGGAALALGAFALVPTKDLRLAKPPLPLPSYLAALMRARTQLATLKGPVEDADWNTLRLTLPAIVGPPGNAKQALYDAIALLDDRATAARAEDVAADVVDALANIDAPRKYFDAMPRVAASGAQNAEFVRFAGAALRRADARIGDFLALMPRDALEAARRQVAAEAAAGGDE